MGSMSSLYGLGYELCESLQCIRGWKLLICDNHAYSINLKMFTEQIMFLVIDVHIENFYNYH